MRELEKCILRWANVEGLIWGKSLERIFWGGVGKDTFDFVGERAMASFTFYIYWVWIHWKSFLEFWLVWEGGNLVHTKVMLLKMTLCVSRRWGSWLWNVFFSFTLYVIALFPLFLHRTRNIRVDGWWPFLFIRRINHSKFWRCWCGGCNSTVERAITFYRQKIWLALHQFSNCWELKLEEEGALCPYFHQTLLLASQLMGPTSSWLGVMVKHHFLLAWPWK